MNVGFLAILFLTALHYDEEPRIEPTRTEVTAIDHTISLSEKRSTPTPPSSAPVDEVDLAIEQFTQAPIQAVEPRSQAPQMAEALPEVPESQPDFVKITVKPGDALERIARANGTTVSELKRINHLERDLLRVGQVLLVPVLERSSAAIAPPEKTAEELGVVFYTVRQGDNPWKIARKFPGVTYYDILRMNDLDEGKARRLRVGDKIRVR